MPESVPESNQQLFPSMSKETQKPDDVTQAEWAQVQQAKLIASLEREKEKAREEGSPLPIGGGAELGREPSSRTPEGIHGADLTPEQREFLRLMRERGGPGETLRSSEIPGDVRIAVRLYWAILEKNPDLFSPWIVDQELAALVNRHAVTEPSAYFEIPPEAAKRMRIKTEGSPIAKELARAIDEFKAREAVMKLFTQKDKYAGDSGNYMGGLFVTPDRAKVDAYYFGVIGQLEKTSEDKEHFGVLVDNAMRGWIDIAEGRVPGMKAPWDSATFKSNMDKAYDYLTANYAQGDRSAVRLAEILIRLLDIHVTYAIAGDTVDPKDQARMADVLRAIGRVDNNDFILDQQKELAERRGEVGKRIEAEISETTNDTAKAAFIGLRQLSEFASPDNPRAVAPPALIGCIPNLTSDALHLLAVKEDRKDGKYISLWELWRNRRVKFGDLPWDQNKWEWNGEGYVGIPKAAEHVPYGLQKFYAERILKFVMRTDFAKAGGVSEGILDPEYLHGLNKPFELVFAIFLGNTGLKRETIRKLIQLTKVNAVASLVVANTYGKASIKSKDVIDLMKSPQVHNKAIQSKVDNYLSYICEAVDRSGFFSIRDHVEGIKLANGRDLYNLERDLLKSIVKERMIGMKPSALVGSWFDQSEIDKMNEVGVYAPFKA